MANFSHSGLVAFIERNKAQRSAFIEIREPTYQDAAGEWHLGRVIESYETADAGGTASARRSMERIAAERR